MRRRGFFTKLLFGAAAVPAIVKAAEKPKYEHIEYSLSTPIIDDVTSDERLMTVGLRHPVKMTTSSGNSLTVTTQASQDGFMWVDCDPIRPL